VGVYLLPYPASVGSTDASASLPARVGVVGPKRFNEIKRRVEGVSQKALTQCLRRLERNGVVHRTVLPAAPLGVEYAVTPLGRTLEGPFEALHAWTTAHLPAVLEAQARFDSR
jgi:DNA-binding HxlR family transcriptional regulator